MTKIKILQPRERFASDTDFDARDYFITGLVIVICVMAFYLMFLSLRITRLERILEVLLEPATGSHRRTFPDMPEVSNPLNEVRIN